MPHKELTSTVYDDLRFRCILIQKIGESLPAPLLEECDLSRARSVLEIGRGAGEWLRQVARRYRDLQCIGIDQNELLAKAASVLTSRNGLSQLAFLAMEMRDITPRSVPRRAVISCISVFSGVTS